MRHILAAFLFSIAFFLPHVSAAKELSSMSAPGIYQALTQTKDWLNTSRPLTPDDLKGRIILIDFWTYCCINCIHVIPKLQELEEEFGDKLTVIGIHSAKFTTEGETANIREAVQKYGIEHPVINDADFRVWNSFGARAWPTIALIGPDGLMKQVYQGEGDIDAMRRDIRNLIEKTGASLVTAPLPLALETEKIPPTVLSFPTKIVPFNDKQLVITDSGHQRVVIVNAEDGKIVRVVGNGIKGFKDGNLESAQFSDPQGVLVDGDLIFVADTGNHRLRQIDLKNETVTTLAGTGERGGYVLIGSHNAKRTALASPWDLAFYPDKNTIAIANAGTHQLWAYDRKDKELYIIAGNGRESIDDGSLPFNSLSQPSGLSLGKEGLYFVDSETSSLRLFNDGDVTTLIGTGLFDFGLKDGNRDTALMQHAIGLYADGSKVYIADTYNHAIRLYENGTLSTLVKDGLKEPNGITKLGGLFYIADTNNHNIVKMEPNGKVLGTLNVMPIEEPLGYQDFLPNPKNYGTQKVAPQAKIVVDVPEGWKINDEAPTYLGIFDANREVVQTISHADIISNKASVAVDPGQYTIQGIVYYCEKKAGAQCLIRGVQAQVEVQEKAETTLTFDISPK